MLKISISGLRYFARYVVPVQGLLVFYGKNGAGKSSIATAFEMLSAGCTALPWRLDGDVRELRGSVSFRAGVYRGDCSWGGAGPKDTERLILAREQLVVQDQKDDTQLGKIEVRTDERESFFGVPVESEPRDVYRIMQEMSCWWIGHLVPSAMWNPETNDTGRRLYPTGRNLEACLLRFVASMPEAFSAVEAAVSAVEPDFVRLAVVNRGLT